MAGEVVGIPKPTKAQKEYEIEREQLDEKAQLKVVKRDFYDSLPRAVCEALDNIYWRWRRCPWFEKAWNDYRSHVLEAETNGTKIKTPGFIFSKYIDEQVKNDFNQREKLMFAHSDLEVDMLAHYGIKGQQWGVRRYQNEDGTLTEAGKRRYLKGYNEAEIKLNTATSQTEKDKAQQKLDEINANQGNYFDSKKWDSDANEADKAKVQVVKEAQNIVLTGANAVNTSSRGSKVINKKDYSKIPDDEMRRRINRLQMEKTYGDLNGDNKYVMTGKEKFKETLQTIGAILGIGASALTIGLLFKQYKGAGRKPTAP